MHEIAFLKIYQLELGSMGWSEATVGLPALGWERWESTELGGGQAPQQPALAGPAISLGDFWMSLWVP